MRRLPVNLAVTGKKVVIVGGGGVALRKCRAVLEAGGAAAVIAPEISPELQDLAEKGQVTVTLRRYRSGDLSGAFLAYAATGDAAVNRRVALDAARLGIPADIADAPEAGAFTSPATIRRGELLITVSTGDSSPAFARRLREELEAKYGPEYGRALRIAAAVRQKLLTEHDNASYNKKLFDRLVDELPQLLRQGDTAGADRLLAGIDPGLTLEKLERKER